MNPDGSNPTQRIPNQGERVRVRLVKSETFPLPLAIYDGTLLAPLQVGAMILLQTDKPIDGGCLFRSRAGIIAVQEIAKTSSTTGGWYIHTCRNTYHVDHLETALKS